MNGVSFDTHRLPLKVDIEKFQQLQRRSGRRVKRNTICAAGLEMLNITAPSTFYDGQLIVMDVGKKSWRKEVRLKVFFNQSHRLRGGTADIVLTRKDAERIDDQVKNGEKALVCVLLPDHPQPGSKERDKLVIKQSTDPDRQKAVQARHKKFHEELIRQMQKKAEKNESANSVKE